jgi:ABC-type multidrug transport system fused ATPase/permease subunit
MGSAPESPRPSRLRGPLARLEAAYLRRYRATLLLCLAGLLGQSLLLLPIPLIQGGLLDRLVAAVRAGGGRVPEALVGPTATAVGLAFGAMAACQLARIALAWAVAANVGRVAQEIVVALRTDLKAKLMRLPMSYFDAHQTGRLMARVTSDVGTILGFVNGGLLQLVNDLLLAVGIAGVLAWLQWRLALVALVAVPLYAANHRRFAGRLHGLSQAIRGQVSAIYALLSERVSAVRVVRAYAREGAELALLDGRLEAHRALGWQNARTNARLGAVATLISGLGTVAVLVLGAGLVLRGRLSVGELLAFYALVGQLYAPIVRLTQFQATAMAAGVSIDRLFEILDEPEPIADRPGARPIARPRGRLEFRDVRFAYRPDAPRVLEGVDLRVEPGMTVGILGPSGAGKSTLLALAPRLYELDGRDGGSIRFDGADVRDWRLADLRRAVLLVSQQPLLFEGTIRSNLAYARPEATEAELRRALEIADLAGTIAAFPLGLETPVGERGLTLSGGQRQRLALARALVADPAVLLLDDCTSALDADTEARIQDALARHLPGRTRVIVSHKTSSVRSADLIVVLEDGRVAEQGTHAALLCADGAYAATVRAQEHALAPAGGLLTLAG